MSLWCCCYGAAAAGDAGNGGGGGAATVDLLALLQRTVRNAPAETAVVKFAEAASLEGIINPLFAFWNPDL